MSNNPVSFVDPDGLTDMNHNDGPRFGRRGVDDPDGRGGRLLGESVIGMESVMWQMEAAAVDMQNKMEGNFGPFDNRVANLEILKYLKVFLHLSDKIGFAWNYHPLSKILKICQKAFNVN